MKGTPMSLRPPSNNYYWNKFKQIASFVFPDQSKLSGALKSAAQGAGIALSAVVITSAFLALVLLVSEKSSDLVSILLSGSAVALGSFGAILVLDPSIASLANLGSDVNVGVHSVTIAVITLAVVYRISRRIAKASRSLESYDLSPFHLALGFGLMTFGISYVSRGLSTNTLGQINFQGVTLLSTVFVFALVWAVSYSGRIRGLATNSDYEYVWRWVSKATKNFVLIYSTLIVLAFIVLIIRTIIEPKYAVAQEPVAMNINLSPDQALWILVGIVLYGANLLIQFFFLAMGVNVGIELQGSQGVANLLSSIDANVLGNASQWSYTLVGPWAYVGILVLVALVALVSGARAADQVGAKFHGVATYIKALFVALFVSLSILFLASVQLSINFTPAEGETVSGGVVWGASLVGVIAFATSLLFLAHQSAGRSFDFLATAFPRTVLGKRNTGLSGPAYPGARAFGVVVISAVLLVAATPIAASTVNRVSALTDGPVQVGEKASKTLTSAPLKELKEFLNPNASRAHKWLSSKVLEAAQPSEGYSSRVLVVNGLDKPWEPGNLDATIVIELEKDGKTISKTFETTSTLKTSGLLTTVKYEPVVSPTTVEVQLSKFLKDQKDLAITLNGEKLKPGKYFAIPGVYKTKAAGYKLVAATESTIYVENESQIIKIGYNVALPEGAGSKLNSAILKKAKECFTLSKSGSSKCIVVDDLDAIAVGSETPSKFFDYSDNNYSASSAKCDTTRKDSLASATLLKSDSECSADVNFTRTFYESKPRKIAKYTTEYRCVGGMISRWWMSDGELLDYKYGWDGWNYYDSNDYRIGSNDREYDSCYTQREVRVQDGFETIQVRGNKITSVTMSAKFTKRIPVQGSLKENGDFVISK